MSLIFCLLPRQKIVDVFVTPVGGGSDVSSPPSTSTELKKAIMWTETARRSMESTDVALIAAHDMNSMIKSAGFASRKLVPQCILAKKASQEVFLEAEDGVERLRDLACHPFPRDSLVVKHM